MDHCSLTILGSGWGDPPLSGSRLRQGYGAASRREGAARNGLCPSGEFKAARQRSPTAQGETAWPVLCAFCAFLRRFRGWGWASPRRALITVSEVYSRLFTPIHAFEK